MFDKYQWHGVSLFNNPSVIICNQNLSIKLLYIMYIMQYLLYNISVYKETIFWLIHRRFRCKFSWFLNESFLSTSTDNITWNDNATGSRYVGSLEIHPVSQYTQIIIIFKMSVPKLAKCCFCVNLRNGALIVGFISGVSVLVYSN